MGLSSKQVSVDGLDWEQNLLQSEELELPKTSLARQQQQQQQQQPAQQLSCPRCDSTNTKFCYYNNYNRSQPRYFCRSCRRHWTKGGTLRNVPIGGGRKNKRHKTSSSSSSSSKTTTNKNSNSHLRGNSYMGIQPQQQQQQQLSLPFGDQKSFSEILYQSLLSQPSYLPDYISKTSNDDGDNIDMNSSSFLGSTLSLPPIPNCPFASLSSFEHNLPPVHSSFNGGFQSSTLYDYTGKIEPTTSTAKLWQSPNTSSFMDSASCWNWEDPTTFVNNDVRQTWNDDSGQKQEGN